MTMPKTRKNDVLLTLAADHLPEALMPAFILSLLVPQRGGYHNEGMYLADHLRLMLKVLKYMASGQFHRQVSCSIQEMLRKAVDDFGEQLLLYALVHDIAKADCLTIVYNDGRKQAVTWREWCEMIDASDEADVLAMGNAEALTRFCEAENISQISYYQETDGDESSRQHGEVAAEQLRPTGIPKMVVNVVREHEVAYQFDGETGGLNLKLFRDRFVDWTEDEVGFLVAASYADTMASLDQEGAPYLENWLAFVNSMLAFRQYLELTARLAQTERLDEHRLSRLVSALLKAKNAFAAESVGQAYDRLVEECRLPEVTEDQVLEALKPAIADGLSEELVQAIVADMTTDGKISPKVGKQLGRHNRTVRPAIAALGK